MKLIANILVWASLAGGVVSAATAYLASLDVPDDRLLGRTLAAPAGRVEQADGTVKPLAEKDETVSRALLAELRAANIKNIRVKEFDLKRWRGKWYFVGSLFGLLAGSLVLRFASKHQVSLPSDTDKDIDPHRALGRIYEEIENVRQQIPKASPEDTLELIVDRLGEVQRTRVPAFVETRETLIRELGLGGFAVLMDSFAGAERQINRAWSAAVDHQYEEAVACLDESAVRLQETLSVSARTQ